MLYENERLLHARAYCLRNIRILYKIFIHTLVFKIRKLFRLISNQVESFHIFPLNFYNYIECIYMGLYEHYVMYPHIERINCAKNRYTIHVTVSVSVYCLRIVEPEKSKL